MRKVQLGRILVVLFIGSCIIGISKASCTAPVATSISPDHGPRGMNTSLTIKGEGFSPGTRVSLWGGGTCVEGSYPTYGSANGLYCSGSYVYLACGQEEETSERCGIQIFHIQNPVIQNAAEPLSFFPLPASTLPQKANDVFVFENYAYVAATGGLLILDVHDPLAPSLISSLPVPGRALKISLYGQYIYIAADSGGLQIVDISNPAQPALAGSFCPSAYVLDVVAEGDYAYLAAGWAGVKIIDISHPREPEIVADFPRPDRFVMGVYKYQENLYLSEMENGVEVLDVFDPFSPVPVSSFTTPGLAQKVSIKGNYLYVADDYRGVEIFDHDPVQGCTMVGFQETKGCAVDLQVFDNHIFVADSRGGFQILDAENPANPSVVSITDLLDGSSGIQVSGLQLEGNYAYIFSKSDSSFEQNWVKVLDISDPENPRLCGMTRNIGSNPEGLVLSQGYAYLLDSDIGLKVLNVTYQQSPQAVSFYDDDTSGGRGIFLRDNTLFLADSLANGKSCLKIFSTDTKMLPSLIGVKSFDNANTCAEAVSVTGDRAFLAAGEAGLAVFDLQQPSLVNTLNISGYIKDVLTCGSYAYLANRKRLVQTINIESSPALAGSCETLGEPRSLSLSENYLYVAEGEAGLQAVDVDQPLNPLAVASMPTLTPAEEVIARGEYIYAAVRNGLMIVRAFKPCPLVSYVDPATINISTPAGLAAGTYNITLTDPSGGMSVFPNGFTIEANRPPVMEPVTANPLIAINEGESLTLSIEASDPDGDTLIYSASLSKLPPGARLSGNIFSWQPGPEDTGLYPDIRFQVSDGEFIVEQEINIAVIDNGRNMPPNLDLAPVGDKIVSEGNLLSFSLSATDAENGSLFFSAHPLPDGAKLEGREFSWRPAFGQSGAYKMLFTVQEEPSGLRDSEEIQITVSHTNRPPELSLVPSQVEGEEGKSVAFLIEAFDPDPDDLEGLKITMLSAPEGAVCRSLPLQAKKVTACFFWTPAYGQTGAYTITFKTSDQQQLSDQKTVSLQIRETAPAAVELKAGLNVWQCPAGRSNYTSFTFLQELGEEVISSIHSYDWDGTLLNSCCWLFGKPSGDNFPMDQSRIYRLHAKRSVSFIWPRTVK